MSKNNNDDDDLNDLYFSQSDEEDDNLFLSANDALELLLGGLSGLLSAYDMAGNYEERCVARYEGDKDCFVSTAMVTDSNRPYETAICHPEYNDGRVIVVESYDTKEQALTGHARWEKMFVDNDIPDEIEDVSQSEITNWARNALGKIIYKKTNKDEKI